MGQKRVPSEQQGLTEQQTASYQGAFEAVLAVPIAAGIGYWCDGQFDSAPLGLLVGVGIGFFAMLLRIMRMRPDETDELDEAAGPTKRATEDSTTTDTPEIDSPEGDGPESGRPEGDRPESDRPESERESDR